MNISEEIQEIIINYLEGDLDQEMASGLAEWLKLDKKNLEYLREFERIWIISHSKGVSESEISKNLKQVRNKLKDRDIRSVPAREIRITIPLLVRITTIAAVITGLALLIPGLLKNKTKPATQLLSMIEASAPRGSRSQLILADSTTIWLNSDSRIRYSTDYGKNNRDIYLEGEAYFSVRKNNDLPFQVSTNEIKITALGTSFNVKAYDDEGTIETTLEEGLLSIALLNPGMKKESAEAIVLQPKQTAVYIKHEGSISHNSIGESEGLANVKAVVPAKVITKDSVPVIVNEVNDTRLYTSWKDPRWIIRNEKLGSLAPKLERRYNITIQIIDKQVEDYTFTGSLLEESLEQILAVIKLSSPIRYEINSKVVTLYEDKFLKKQYDNFVRNK